MRSVSLSRKTSRVPSFFLSCTAAQASPRIHLNSACRFSSGGSCERLTFDDHRLLLSAVRPPCLTCDDHRLLLNASRLPCLSCPVFLCSPHVRAFTCSEASVPPLPRSCVCWSLLLWSFPSFAVVFMEPECPFHSAPLSWTLRCCLEHLYPLLGHSLLLLSVLVQAVLNTFPAPRPVAARECPNREALSPSFFLNVVPTCFDVAVASPREHLATASVSCASLSHLPSASHACGTDFLSPSTCLAYVATCSPHATSVSEVTVLVASPASPRVGRPPVLGTRCDTSESCHALLPCCAGVL